MAQVQIMSNLIRFESKTDKLVQFSKTQENGDKTETQGTVRSFTVDYNIKKALGLVGIYVAIVNVNAPTILLNIVSAFVGGG